MAIHESAAKGFSAGADAYERGRPDYAPDAIATLVRELGIGPGKRVLDLAAGTGKLTRQLVDTGAELVAVEPIAEMRAKLVATVPGRRGARGHGRADPAPESLGRCRGRRPGVPLVRRRSGRERDSPRPAPDGRARADLAGARPATGPGSSGSRRSSTRPTTAIRASGPAPGARRSTASRCSSRSRTRRSRTSSAASPRRSSTGSRRSATSRRMPEDRRAVVLDEVRDAARERPGHRGRRGHRAAVPRPRLLDAPARHPGRNVDRARRLGERLAGRRAEAARSPATRVRPARARRRRPRRPENHGGPLQAVCLYAVEAIERIAGEGHQAFPGAYGENLTLAGHRLGRAAAGDRLRIGDGGPAAGADRLRHAVRQAGALVHRRADRADLRRGLPGGRALVRLGHRGGAGRARATAWRSDPEAGLSLSPGRRRSAASPRRRRRSGRPR